MKILTNAMTILGLVMFSSCSSGPRKPSSIIYTCQFSEKVGDTVRHFEFVPDDHSLMVDKTDIAFEESDFASGAYVYRTLKKNSDWKAELVFVSYEPKARVYLKLMKSPLNTAPVSIIKDCE